MADSKLERLTGDAAVPRRNGELVFDEPWQSRAFGLAVGLAERGVFDWEEFRTRLITAVRDDGGDEQRDREMNQRGVKRDAHGRTLLALGKRPYQGYGG